MRDGFIRRYRKFLPYGMASAASPLAPQARLLRWAKAADDVTAR